MFFGFSLFVSIISFCKMLQIFRNYFQIYPTYLLKSLALPATPCCSLALPGLPNVTRHHPMSPEAPQTPPNVTRHHPMPPDTTQYPQIPPCAPRYHQIPGHPFTDRVLRLLAETSGARSRMAARTVGDVSRRFAALRGAPRG